MASQSENNTLSCYGCIVQNEYFGVYLNINYSTFVITLIHLTVTMSLDIDRARQSVCIIYKKVLVSKSLEMSVLYRHF